MANIAITLPYNDKPVDGQLVTFRAPCSCEKTNLLLVNGQYAFTVVDAMNNEIPTLGILYAKDALVSVILDVTYLRAYLINPKIPYITYGTGEPTDGSDGDIYIQVNG